MGNGVYHFSNLAQFPDIFHGVSSRHMGNMMEEPLRDKFLKKVAGREYGRLILWGKQPHGDAVYIHREGKPLPSFPRKVEDAFVTNAKNVVLLVQTADCQPILLFDPVKRVVAAVHSGWRGSAKNIVGRTVEMMQAQFGVDPATMWAGVGPSLGPCCAEFSDPDRELPTSILAHRVEEHRIDFWAVSMAQLRDAGVQPEHIECANICTVCHVDEWFSHRGGQRRGEPAGRGAAVIGLRPVA